MKRLRIAFFFALFAALPGCSEDSQVNQTVIPKSQVDTTGSGYGKVVGYQGYFSPAQPPSGGELPPLPSGYVMTNFNWESGGADTSYGMIYLMGREEELAKAHRVRVEGSWLAITAANRTIMFHYVILSIDNLTVLE